MWPADWEGKREGSSEARQGRATYVFSCRDGRLAASPQGQACGRGPALCGATSVVLWRERPRRHRCVALWAAVSRSTRGPAAADGHGHAVRVTVLCLVCVVFAHKSVMVTRCPGMVEGAAAPCCGPSAVSGVNLRGAQQAPGAALPVRQALGQGEMGGSRLMSGVSRFTLQELGYETLTPPVCWRRGGLVGCEQNRPPVPG